MKRSTFFKRIAGVFAGAVALPVVAKANPICVELKWIKHDWKKSSDGQHHHKGTQMIFTDNNGVDYHVRIP